MNQGNRRKPSLRMRARSSETPRAPAVAEDTDDDLPPVLGPAIVKGKGARRAPTPMLDKTDEMPSIAHRADTVPAIVAAQPLAADRATLTIVHGVDAGQVFAIERDAAVLGRDHAVEFFVDDPAISRRHCRFRHTDERYFVEDLGSANGTFIAGRRLRELQLAELFTGDRIQIGPNVVVRFSLSDRLEEQMQRRLYASATRDALTQTFNKSYLLERLAIEVASARRHRHALAVLAIEVDRMQSIAAAKGPTSSGRLLQSIAARMMRGLRIEDVIGRTGGDRFVVIVRAADLPGATVLADRLRTAVRELAVATETGKLSATVSIGVATLSELEPKDGDAAFLALAEARMSEASRAGGDRVVTSSRARR